MQKIKGPMFLANSSVPARDGSKSILRAGTLPAAANGARVEGFALLPMRARFYLAGVTIAVTAANDYGGVKIADFQNQNLMISGMMLNVAGTLTAPNVGTELTLALGTATASNATLSAAMIDYVNGKTGVGAAQTFTCQGHSFDNTGGNFGNAGATPYLIDNHATNNDLFLNAALAVASGTTTITFTAGHVDVFYDDLDEPVAL